MLHHKEASRPGEIQGFGGCRWDPSEGFEPVLGDSTALSEAQDLMDKRGEQGAAINRLPRWT